MCRSQQLFLLQSAEVPVSIDRWWWWWCCVVVVIVVVIVIIYNGWKIRDTDYINLTQPLLMVHGTDDPITCFHVSKKLFDKAPSTDKKFEP